VQLKLEEQLKLLTHMRVKIDEKVIFWKFLSTWSSLWSH